MGVATGRETIFNKKRVSICVECENDFFFL